MEGEGPVYLKKPPSGGYALDTEVDKIVRALSQKCIFCNEPFKYEYKKEWNNAGEYYVTGWEIYGRVAQIDVYVLHIAVQLSSNLQIETIFKEKQANLELKLQNIDLDKPLIDAARTIGMKIEYADFKAVNDTVANLIPKPSRFVGFYEGDPVYAYPPNYKCHKSCWPEKDTFTIEEILQTSLEVLLKYQLAQIPEAYASVIPALKQSVVNLSQEDYDPFK